jgi:hypothetical protein
MPENIEQPKVEEPSQEAKDMIKQILRLNKEELHDLQLFMSAISKDDDTTIYKAIADYYINLHAVSTKFLRHSNELGMASTDPKAIEKTIIPLHKFLTKQMNKMIQNSQMNMKKRGGR